MRGPVSEREGRAPGFGVKHPRERGSHLPQGGPQISAVWFRRGNRRAEERLLTWHNSLQSQQILGHGKWRAWQEAQRASALAAPQAGTSLVIPSLCFLGQPQHVLCACCPSLSGQRCVGKMGRAEARPRHSVAVTAFCQGFWWGKHRTEGSQK